MLIRISLIVAIVAGLAVGGLSFIKVKEKITTIQGQRDEEKAAKETAQKNAAPSIRVKQARNPDDLRGIAPLGNFATGPPLIMKKIPPYVISCPFGIAKLTCSRLRTPS